MEKIQYHKWNKDEFIFLKKKCNEILNLREIQIYQPYFSLYFHIHNTKNSHKYFDLRRNYILKDINEASNCNHYTSNTFLKVKIHDLKNNNFYEEEIFCKSIPLLDPVHYMMDNYNTQIHRNPLLPSCYNFNTSNKINKSQGLMS